jgi:hypothetical protein
VKVVTTYRLKLSELATLLVQALLAVGVIALGIWYEMSAVATVSLALVIITGIAASVAWTKGNLGATCESALSWVFATLAATTLFNAQTYLQDCSPILVAVAAWITATALVPSILRSDRAVRRLNWKIQTLFWCLFGTAVLLRDAYSKNISPSFYSALAMLVLLLIGLKVWFQRPPFLIIAENTAILLLIGLAVSDIFVRPAIHTTINGDPPGRYSPGFGRRIHEFH